VKDLSKLGRPLDKMIIVDNLAENFILQKDNGIFIETWLEDTSDTQLRDMIPLLKQLVVNNVKDVRVSLRSFRDQMARLISTGNGNALPPIE
jgi:CTD small phosphatase-like protein 2